jgi:hypothetical protein
VVRAVNIIGITGKAGSGKDAVADSLCTNHGLVRVALADSMKRFCKEIFGFTDEQLWGPSELRNVIDKRLPRKHTWVQADGIVQLQEFGGHEFKCACCGAVSDEETPQCYLTPRFALQQLGTEFGRAMFEDVWINYAMRDASQLLSGVRSFEDAEGGPSLMVPVYKPNAGLYFVPAGDASLFVGRGPQCKGVVIPDCRFPNELAAIRAVGGRIWHRPGKGNLSPSAAAHASENSLDEDAQCDAHIPWYPGLSELDAFVAVVLAKDEEK